MAVVLAATALFFGLNHRSPPSPTASNPSVASAALVELAYVGQQKCAACHREQAELWQGSHHDLAMQVATESTVLGDFNEAVFRKDGVESRFFKRDGKYWILTDGPDGKLAEFEAKYTFGVFPLQQYLLELPGGRLQALSIAWDSRSKDQGGQRWFHLYPNEAIDHKDELHWTKLSQNWNYMCAECHSTNLKKNYDPTSQHYNTTWSELDVACEACHGPGSRHVVWAETGGKPELTGKGLTVNFDERRGIQWSANTATGKVQRSQARTTDKEIQVCSRCHSRRGQWFDDSQPGQHLMQTHLPGLLRETLYFADGQIDGEVYEVGSLLQSKMYHAGITCSDCHEPHSLKLRANGSAVCQQCHLKETYADSKHHFHPDSAKAPDCLDCHSPTRNYMVVHPRHDHSFRIPRPELSVKLGTPNACNQCHSDKTAQWAAAQLKTRLGRDPKGYQAYAEALHSARTGSADAGASLLEVIQNKDQPAIARATALSEMRRRLNEANFPAVVASLSDPDPLVRVGALEAQDAIPLEQRWQFVHPLLRDPFRVVRALAAEALAGFPKENLSPNQLADWEKARAEYLQSQTFNADQPGSLVNLGSFHAAEGNWEEAEKFELQALKQDSDWIPAYVNLSDLYRQQGKDSEGEKVLQEGIRHQPQSAALYQSLGLLKVRQKDMTGALASLKKSTELAPEDTHFRYVYGLALLEAGNREESRKVVHEGLKKAPGDALLIELNRQIKSKPKL